MTDELSTWTMNLGLSKRTYNYLQKAGMGRIEQLESASDTELLAIPQFGPSRLKEVRERLALYHSLPWPPKQGEELQNGASGQNKLGDTITLWLPDEEEGVEWPQVSWTGAHFQGLCFITETDEQARALYTALLTIKDVDAD